MTKSNLALSNLRAVVILIVLAFHSMLAYLGSLDVTSYAFDSPPYKWRAFPIIDTHRWFGFDIFCASQDVSLMSLMFFLSALFTWPSLNRKGTGKFLGDRLLRLGIPLLFAFLVVVPIALYPTYRVSASDPGLSAYAHHWLALPFWPNGPMWFLWLLLALTVFAAALHRFVPQWIEALGKLSTSAGERPVRFFVVLTVASAIAYVPLALAFTPWAWSDSGPLALQLSRPLHYVVYYLAGLGVGAFGLDRGLLAPDGKLARAWGRWLTGGLAAFVLWMGLMALSMRGDPSPLALQIAVDLSFAVACAGLCFAIMAICLRFGRIRSPVFNRLAESAYGLYLVHYVFVVWLQYTFLNLALPAILKATLVFGATLVLSWTTIAILQFLPFGARLIGTEPRHFAKAPAAMHPTV